MLFVIKQLGYRQPKQRARDLEQQTIRDLQLDHPEPSGFQRWQHLASHRRHQRSITGDRTGVASPFLCRRGRQNDGQPVRDQTPRACPQTIRPLCDRQGSGDLWHGPYAGALLYQPGNHRDRRSTDGSVVGLST